MQPPSILLNRDAMWTDASTFRLEGTLIDDALVEDYYIWIYSDNAERLRPIKVTYRHAQAAEYEMTEDLPLFPGANRIVVIARDDQQMTASELMFVYRRTPGEPVSNVP